MNYMENMIFSVLLISLNLSSPSFQSLNLCPSPVMFLPLSPFTVLSNCSWFHSKDSHDTRGLLLFSFPPIHAALVRVVGLLKNRIYCSFVHIISQQLPF